MIEHKSCTVCGVTKHYDDFHKHAKTPGGRHSHCKVCTSKKEARQKAEKIANGTWAEFCSRKTARNLKRSKNNPIARRAQSMLKYRVKKGMIERLACEVCGTYPSEGHHDDYAKPLDVRWLCAAHHRQWHVKNGPGLNGDVLQQGENSE